MLKAAKSLLTNWIQQAIRGLTHDAPYNPYMVGPPTAGVFHSIGAYGLEFMGQAFEFMGQAFEFMGHADGTGSSSRSCAFEFKAGLRIA